MIAAHSLVLYLQFHLIIYGFLNLKPERDTKVVKGICFAGLVVFDIFRHIYYGYQAVREYTEIIYILLPIILILYSLNTWRLWWLTAISYVFASFVSMVVTYFFFPIFQLENGCLVTNSLCGVFSSVLGLSMLFLFYYATRKAKLELNIQGLTRGEIGFILFFLMLFGFFVSSLYFLGYAENPTFVDHLINFLSLIGGMMGIYAIFYLITKDNKLKDAKKREEEQQEIHKQQQLLFAKIEEQNIEVRRFKHDIDFELVKLNEYAENGNLNDILLHIAEMREDFATRSQIEWVETGINELNANLLTLATMPEYKDIKLKWSGGIPDNIKISSRDRSLLFSNLFKNAFEAASKCDDEKYIHVKVVSRKNKLKIKIKNNFTGEIKEYPKGSFITTKEDKLNHGFGTMTIKKIVEKYNGSISFEYENNEFKVTIAFTGSIYE